MSNLVLGFTFRNKNYLWFINDNYISLVSFIITLTILKIIKIRADRKAQIQKITNIPPGGDIIDSCIEPDNVYKVIADDLKNALISMLDIRTPGRYFISPSVLFTSYSLLQTSRMKEALLTKGLRFVILDYKSLVIKGAIGIVAGAIAGYAGMRILLQVFWNLGLHEQIGIGVGSLAVLRIAGQLYMNVPCNEQLAELPSMIGPGTQIVRYLPKPIYPNPREIGLYVKSDPEIPVHESVDSKHYLRTSNSDDQVCVVNEGSNAQSLTQSCIVKTTTQQIEDKILTMDDLKRLDSTEVRKSAKPLYERHKLKQERFKAKRLAIMENRNKNHVIIEEEEPTQAPKHKKWEEVAKNLV